MVRAGHLDEGDRLLVNWLLVLRLVVISESTLLLAFFAVAIRRSKLLAETQPDGSLTSNVNMLAYAGVMLAVSQGMISQTVRLIHHAPFVWFGTPFFLVWETTMLVWAIQRVRWHRGAGDAARMTNTDGGIV